MLFVSQSKLVVTSTILKYTMIDGYHTNFSFHSKERFVEFMYYFLLQKWRKTTKMERKICLSYVIFLFKNIRYISNSNEN